MGTSRPRPERIALSIELPAALPISWILHEAAGQVPPSARSTGIVQRGKAEMRYEVRVGYLSDWLSTQKGEAEGEDE